MMENLKECLNELQGAISQLSDQKFNKKFRKIAKNIADCMSENVKAYEKKYGQYTQEDIYPAIHELIKENFTESYKPSIFDFIPLVLLMTNLEEQDEDALAIKFIRPLLEGFKTYGRADNEDEIKELEDQIVWARSLTPETLVRYRQMTILHTLCLDRLAQLQRLKKKTKGKIEGGALENQIDVVEELIGNIRQSNIENFKKNFHENEKLLSSDPMEKSFVDKVKSVFCYMATKVCGFFGRAYNPSNYRGKFAKEVEKQVPSLAPAA